MRRPRLHRGSTLILTVVLLAVLAVIGAAAISLGSQERVNASAKGKRDQIFACANAARMTVWSEVSRYGRGYLDSANVPGELVLSDGTRLKAPAHYDDSSNGMTVEQLALKNTVATASAGMAVDLTNTFHFMQNLTHGTAYTVVARCRDASGRELEVEFVTSLIL